MKIPAMCTKSNSFDRVDAGWYVPNSVILRDIKPDWRLPGGGVIDKYLDQDVNDAFDKAIAYTKQHIIEAESHLRKLEKAKADG